MDDVTAPGTLHFKGDAGKQKTSPTLSSTHSQNTATGTCAIRRCHIIICYSSVFDCFFSGKKANCPGQIWWIETTGVEYNLRLRRLMPNTLLFFVCNDVIRCCPADGCNLSFYSYDTLTAHVQQVHWDVRKIKFEKKKKLQHEREMGKCATSRFSVSEELIGLSPLRCV